MYYLVSLQAEFSPKQFPTKAVGACVGTGDAADVSWEVGMLLSMVATYVFKHLRNPQPQELLICNFQSCVVTFLQPHYGIYLKGLVLSITNNINKKFFVRSLGCVHFQTTHTTQNIAYSSILRFNILPCCWQCDFMTLDYKVKGCFVSDF